MWETGTGCSWGHFLLDVENGTVRENEHQDPQGRRAYTMLRLRNPIVEYPQVWSPSSSRGHVIGPAADSRDMTSLKDTLKAPVRSRSGASPADLGEVWRYGCPKSPGWDSDIGERADEEEVSEYVVWNMRHVLEGPLWGELVRAFLVPEDGLCMRTTEARTCASCRKADYEIRVQTTVPIRLREPHVRPLTGSTVDRPLPCVRQPYLPA